MTSNPDDDVVTYTADAGVAWIQLNRPRVLNALNTPLRLRFRDLMDRARSDDLIKVIVITGSGGRAFSSGADLKEIGTRSAMQRRAMYAHEPSAIVRATEKPVIAGIRGYALGGGLELASACDLRIAADDAILGYPEIEHGWVPAGGGTSTLPGIVGLSAAMKLVLTGQKLSAAEAAEIGLVDEVHPADRFDDELRRLAESIAQRPLGVLLLAKASLRMAAEAGADAAHRYEREIGSLMYTLEGRAEALAAFEQRSGRGGEAR
jgi:enoyl-CoA hydratase/carnithine racemase